MLLRLPPYSEFMASFAVLAFLLIPGRGAALALCRRWPAATLATSVALAFGATAFAPLPPPQLALVIPAPRDACFPLLSYLPWLLAGACYAFGGAARPWRLWLAAFAASAPWAALSFAAGLSPDRFPPTPLWLLGPAILLLAYAALCDKLAAHGRFAVALRRIGAAPLTHLLVSTLAIFLLFHAHGRFLASTVEVALAFGLILLAGCAADLTLRRAAALRLRLAWGSSPRRAFG